MATIQAAGRVVTLEVFSGKIVAEKKWTTTEVTSDGGGGSLNQGSGYISAPDITSTTTTHDQIFVCAPDGTERAVGFQGVDLAVRAGHRVSLISGTSGGIKDSLLLAMVNHNTRTVDVMPNSLLTMSRSFLTRMRIPLVILAAVSWFLVPGGQGRSFGVVLMAVGVAGIWRFRRRRTLLRARLTEFGLKLEGPRTGSAEAV